MKKLISPFIFLLFVIPFLNAQISIPNTLSNEEKLYGLSKFWQEVNYNFAFFDQVPDLDWDEAYREFIPKVLATKNDFEYYRTLQRFCALLKDGHTNVYIPRRIDSLRYSNSFGKYRLYLDQYRQQGHCHSDSKRNNE